MSPRDTFWRRFGFWTGPVVLLVSLLLAVVVLLGTAYFPPFVFLLLFPIGGLLLGVALIARGTQPRWAKLLALFPVLAPLLILAVTLLPRSPNQLVFLIPEGFRGQVSLSRQHDMPQRFTRVAGQIVLEVPADGQLTTSEALGEDDLASAEYYLVNAAGQRLRPLRPLDERVFERQGPRNESGAPVVDPQQVGVFTAGLRYQRAPQATPYPTKFPSEVHYSPTKKVNRLVFTVSCYDSLAVILRRSDF